MDMLNDIQSMTLIIMTNNAHKIKEIKEILDLDGLKIVSYRDVFKDPIDVVEDGVTFEENAIKKVTALPHVPGGIILSEDSGIEVDHLNGAPGIYSARYAGENATCQEMCRKLLKDCYGAGNRDAQYQAVIAIRFPDGNIETVSGIVRGYLTHEMSGEEGFGYDTIFVPEGYDITFADMPASKKNKLSHRYHALIQVKALLESQFPFWSK